MTSIELTGWAAAALTLVAFTSRDVQRLRLASIGASVAFIVFAAATAAWPVLVLHALLLPINLRRLLQLRTATGARPWPCAWRGRPVWLALAMLVVLMPGPAASATHAERMHARAVDSFRQGRFSEAYGRFVELANLQHRDSARYAMWMCENGPALFGKQWDCAPHEMEDWARSASAAPASSTARMNAPVKRGTTATPMRH